MATEVIGAGLAEPHLLAWLSSLGLGVEYQRAEGNTLYFLGENGEEIPVTDFAGGYGSLMFGHNNPEIMTTARRLLDEQTPVHAQFSRHGYAERLAERLNAIVGRELRTSEPYPVIFANTGAEAVEAAVKHAELDRGLRAREVTLALAERVEEARVAVSRGEAVLSAAAHRLAAEAGASLDGSAEEAFEALVREVERRNAPVLDRGPVLVTLEGSFHGKLVGSVQLTHNSGYRTPFSALGAQSRFVCRERPEALREVLESERATLLDLRCESGVVELVRTDYPVLCAFLVEPVQGEGGMYVMTPEYAREARRICAEAGCPIVVDEVQCGMGRTGTFLASTQIGLHADYYALAKSIGGGIAKSSVLLISSSRYRWEFELVHSSTFAKDAFSCHIALTVLEMLERDGGGAYRRAAERGARLSEMFEKVRGDFPDVVAEVRGKGLMLGLELREQSQARSPEIREQADVLGYAVAGYLLRAHRIRTFPTASAVNTLRFEPSLLLTDGEIATLERALRDVAQLLRDQDGHTLTAA